MYQEVDIDEREFQLIWAGRENKGLRKWRSKDRKAARKVVEVVVRAE